MKRKILMLLAAVMLIVSCCSVCYATADDEAIQPYDTSSISFSIDRTSSTTASVAINVSFDQKVDQYSVVVYLEKLVNGSWQLDTTNKDYVYYNNGWNKYSFQFSKNYTDLKRGQTYRIRCVSKDYEGNISHTSTAYSYSF